MDIKIEKWDVTIPEAWDRPSHMSSLRYLDNNV